MATSYRISRNRNFSSRNDELIKSIEGVYQYLDHAIDRASDLKLFSLPDGTIRLYDRDATDKEILADIAGYDAVGSIEEVV
ncbi:MAG: hypothetical protein ABR986_10045 [Methanomassiliicoccales archaeon]|jgi:hypothetical protein